MKTVLPIILFLISTLSVNAQTDGISYQAVIIDPNPKELPGVDAEGNILPNAAIAIRFTILDSNNAEEYQEIQTTTTDQFGMINLMIGQGEPTGAGTGDFTTISWDGNPKSLQVEIDFKGTGNSFVDMNRQELSFVPYAYHRDIVATGTLTVDDATDLNGELRVHGPTTLNSSLDVNNDNATNLTGSLTVGAATNLNDRLTVNGITNINDSLNINNQSPTHFSGDITVAAEGTATFEGPTSFKAPAEFVEMTVNGPSNLRGQVTVRANVDSMGNEDEYQAYPLLVEGSKQGIAIKVNEGRSTNNNYISFWDNNQMWGRIEGQTTGDLHSDPEYLLEAGFKTTDILLYTAEQVIGALESGQAVVKLTAAGASSTACAGLGACVTAPIPSLIVEAGSNLILKIANAVLIGANLVLKIADEAAFIAFKNAQIGVTYQSGAGDYAEWLPKANPSEVFLPGDLIGVNNGYISKNTIGAGKIMIISTRPIVLGNMPPENQEGGFEKVAFIGQVPAKVIGKVQAGDYILPSEYGSGFGKAVHPSNLKAGDYKKVAGVAWSVLEQLTENVSIVNVAVGLNINDLSGIVAQQTKEIETLKAEVSLLKEQGDQLNAILSDLVPGFEESIGFKTKPLVARERKASFMRKEIQKEDPDVHLEQPQENDIVYYQVSNDEIMNMIDMARNIYLETGEKMEDHPFWEKMELEPGYQDEIIQLIETKFEKAIHTHKEYNDSAIHKH